MTNEEAAKMLTAKVECMERENSGTDLDCDECELCYAQGTLGEQIEALRMAISALEKQDVPEVNVGDTIDLQFLQPESENVFYDSDHGFCINTQDVLDYLRKELRNG